VIKEGKKGTKKKDGKKGRKKRTEKKDAYQGRKGWILREEERKGGR
jgi:hypothetical protein